MAHGTKRCASVTMVGIEALLARHETLKARSVAGLIFVVIISHFSFH
jgi:hypothetical protein